MWPFTKWRRKQSPPMGGGWYPGFPGAGPAGGDPFWSWGSLGGATLTPEAAEALAAVGACIAIISDTIANLPAWVARSDNSRAVVLDHPLAALIEQGCNDNETWGDVLTSFVSAALLRGNGLIEHTSDERGRLKNLATIPFQQCTPLISDAGDLMFDFVPSVPPGVGKRRRLLKQDVVLLKDRSDNGVLGVPRLQRAASSVQAALDLQRQSTQFLGNTVRPSGLLTTDQRIGKDVAERFRQDWQEAYSGAGTGRLAVLHSGLQFKALSEFTPEDAQLVELKAFSVQDISRIFSVPLFFLGDPNRATFASAREATKHLSVHTLAPWITKIERAFAQSVLSARYRLRIDSSVLLRGDDTYATTLQRYRQAGIISPNEAREELDYPRSSDAGADSLAPPNTSAAAVAGDQSPPADQGGKVIEIGDHRHASD